MSFVFKGNSAEYTHSFFLFSAELRLLLLFHYSMRLSTFSEKMKETTFPRVVRA
jgi:hypothetical protein